MHPLLFAVAQAHAEEPAPLEAEKILIYLAIIAATVFFVVLAGFGYFSPGNDGGPAD